MLTVSRRLDSEAAIQKVRDLLCGAERSLRAIVVSLQALSTELDSRALDQALPLIEKVLDESLDAHARIDADLLISTEGSWSHPVQAIGAPRAPYGRVAAQCLERLAQAQGEELERLQAVHQRVQRAHQFAETARRRRLERADWRGEEAEA